MASEPASSADTIYALSSGSPPAAIAVVRISGPGADRALERIAGALPPPRTARVAELRTHEGEPLDRALVLRFPGPASATGQNVAELHLHGGRAVVAAVLAELAGVPGLRAAEPGEFTRRAFDNGRIDLAQAEGLADLLAAETQSQRRAALALASGGLSRKVALWEARLVELAAEIEAVVDFSDEGEVGDALPAGWGERLGGLLAEVEDSLARPAAERLRDGIKVVIAGPPNSGKSSLLNWLAGRDAAIISSVPGTTRDLVEAPTAIAGTPLLLVDTAGLRDEAGEVETIGIERARRSLAAADLILWLGDPGACPDPARALLVQSMVDIVPPDPRADLHVSAESGEGMDGLVKAIVTRARALLPQEGDVALNGRQRSALLCAHEAIMAAAETQDVVILAEHLRGARRALDTVTGRAGVEDVLDALFGRFCIGK